MTMSELVRATRSYRRFLQTPIAESTLMDLVDLARLTASGANLQPLAYLLSATPDRNRLIFPCLALAGYLKNWNGPETEERPTAYIIILSDRRRAEKPRFDPGIAAQTIALGATEKRLGTCMIGSVSRNHLQEALSIPDWFEIELVIALGEPGETVVLEDVSSDKDIQYYRDEQDHHHVPKRTQDEVIYRPTES